VSSEQVDKKAAESLVEKLNKSGEHPLEEFKLGVRMIDKPVQFIDDGVRAIQNKLHRGSSESNS